MSDVVAPGAARQFRVFVAVGLVCVLVDVGLLQLLLGLGIHPLLAASAGFSASLVLNFALHTRVTFAAAWSTGAMVRYAIVVLVNYGLTLGFVSATCAMFGNAMVGKLLSLPVITGTGFLLSRHWVFR